jgi:hypothetical protein
MFATTVRYKGKASATTYRSERYEKGERAFYLLDVHVFGDVLPVMLLPLDQIEALSVVEEKEALEKFSTL